MYGINLDESMGGSEFEYLIADNYDPAKEIPDGFATRTIPAHTWAVFSCTGKMPQALQELNRQIFSQWLPTTTEYKIAAGINVELYSDASKFEPVSYTHLFNRELDPMYPYLTYQEFLDACHLTEEDLNLG